MFWVPVFGPRASTLHFIWSETPETSWPRSTELVAITGFGEADHRVELAEMGEVSFVLAMVIHLEQCQSKHYSIHSLRGSPKSTQVLALLALKDNRYPLAGRLKSLR